MQSRLMPSIDVEKHTEWDEIAEQTSASRYLVSFCATPLEWTGFTDLFRSSLSDLLSSRYDMPLS